MANYCRNRLTIVSEDSTFIDTLVEIVDPPKAGFFSKLFHGKPVRDYGLLGFMKPMPEELKKTITNGFSGEAPPWNKWMVDNWGCAYDVAVDETVRKSPTEIEFKFLSRYSPPVPAVAHGASTRGFQYRLVYCEPGSKFAGIATEAEHQEFVFSFDVHPRDEGVPQEIIDEFDLEEIYEEVKEDEGNGK